jgi:hypothetical protein
MDLFLWLGKAVLAAWEDYVHIVAWCFQSLVLGHHIGIQHHQQGLEMEFVVSMEGTAAAAG